ncbi:MAG: hypothetical protein KC933_26380 [Myxococcales bacterium]|nr:hypothetical protein [Myxococcales bacterium]MCB9652113.1 hypothetical protein [Deltaproteobacteria bacterium]
MRNAKWSLILVLAAAACGGVEEEPEQRISFTRHALECEIPGCYQLPEGIPCIQAKLEATNVEGVCPLNVNGDRTVSGTCRTPAQEIRDFRLVYYTYQGVDEVQLAVVTARLDLRNETRDFIRLEFPQSRLDTDFDDDLDERTNISEVCAGTNPRQAD